MLTIRLTPIIPKEMNSRAYSDQLMKTAIRLHRQIARDARSITKTWEHDPKWRERAPYFSGNHLIFEISSDDSILGWLDKGVEGHTIVRGDSPFFILPQTFSPKTQPWVIGSVAGTREGISFVRQEEIEWPGIEARHFEEALIAKWSSVMQDELQNAFDKGAHLSGHFLREVGRAVFIGFGLIGRAFRR